MIQSLIMDRKNALLNCRGYRSKPSRTNIPQVRNEHIPINPCIPGLQNDFEFGVSNLVESSLITEPEMNEQTRINSNAETTFGSMQTAGKFEKTQKQRHIRKTQPGELKIKHGAMIIMEAAVGN